MFQYSQAELSLEEALSAQFRQRITHGLIILLLLIPVLLSNYRGVQAAGEPTLTISDATVNVMNGSTFTVPISFANGSNSIAAVSFSLDIDESCLTFDSVTDGNSDGIPDTVTGLPAGYVTTVSYDAANTNGEISLSISDQISPTEALSDGVLATFEFGVQSSCRTNDGTTESAPFAFLSPTFGSTSGSAVAGNPTGGTYTLRFNALPTNISLNVTSVNENAALGTTVGSLSSTDPDTDLLDNHTYSLVSGVGSTDNSAFTIVGANLKTNTVFNYEADASYSIRVRTTDSYGGNYEKSFTITINDVNEAPTSLSISSNSVNENAASNTVIGSFSSVDADAGATAAYSLVSGVGDTDNSFFNISGTSLRASTSFNYENKSAYNIRVQVSDGVLTFENIFTIRINDINDAPVASDDVVSPEDLVVAGPINLTVLGNDTDEDINDVLKVASVATPSHGTAITGTTSITYTPEADFNGVVTFAYTARDNHPGGTLTDDANVSVTVVANDARGDCNSDDAVNAGDFTALVLELNDTDISNNWYESYVDGFAGSPQGCDTNANKNITVADLTCAVLVSFGNTTCTTTPTALADVATPAELEVGQNLVGIPSNTVDVPIVLKTNGQRVAAANFALSFDPKQLTFNDADIDHNGLPDAVSFHVPQGMVTVANYNAAASRLEITIYAMAIPMPILADGLVASVKLQVNPSTTAAEASVVLTQGSLGSDLGQTVPVLVNSSSIRLTSQHSLFLPMLER